jgi:hypothetical protein
LTPFRGLAARRTRGKAAPVEALKARGRREQLAGKRNPLLIEALERDYVRDRYAGEARDSEPVEALISDRPPLTGAPTLTPYDGLEANRRQNRGAHFSCGNSRLFHGGKMAAREAAAAGNFAEQKTRGCRLRA